MATYGKDSASPLSGSLIDKINMGHLNNAGEDRAKGLTKREHFAAMAMQGLLSSVDVSLFDSEELTKASVRISDELIEALNK